MDGEQGLVGLAFEVQGWQVMFKFSEDFSQDLRTVIDKPGVRVFVVEALAELEDYMLGASPRFLRGIQTGQVATVNLSEKGVVQIMRTQGVAFVPRYLLRFMGAPRYVMVGLCDLESDFWAEGEVRSLCFTAVVEIAKAMDTRARLSDEQNVSGYALGAKRM